MTEPFTLDQMANPRRRKLWPWILLTAVLLLAAGGVLAFALRPDPELTRSTAPTIGAAYAACEVAVGERLKAPGTAKFGGQDYRKIDTGYYELVGWVDAQNGFGATIRNRYVCKAFEGDTGWRISGVTFTDW